MQQKATTGYSMDQGFESSVSHNKAMKTLPKSARTSPQTYMAIDTHHSSLLTLCYQTKHSSYIFILLSLRRCLTFARIKYQNRCMRCIKYQSSPREQWTRNHSAKHRAKFSDLETTLNTEQCEQNFVYLLYICIVFCSALLSALYIHLYIYIHHIYTYIHYICIYIYIYI